MKKKRTRIYYQKKPFSPESFRQDPPEKRDNNNENSDPKPKNEENEPEPFYSTRIQEPDKPESAGINLEPEKLNSKQD
jgi:hypothetical protein